MTLKTPLKSAIFLMALISFGAPAKENIAQFQPLNLIEQAQIEANKEVRITNLQSRWLNPLNRSLGLSELIPELSLDQEFLSSMVHVLWNAEDIHPSFLRENLLKFYQFLPNLESLKVQDQVKVILLGLKSNLGIALKAHLTQKLYHLMAKKNPDDGVFYLILSEYSTHRQLSKKYLRKFIHNNSELYEKFVKATTPPRKVPTASELKELFDYNPDLSTHLGGVYNNSMKLFVLCRTSRNYPCRMVMKDSKGEWSHNPDGSLWTNPVLALSKYNYPFNKKSGHTPSGIYKMDSVIPYPTSPNYYGQFRRVILNFIPKSKNEMLQTYLLPDSMKELSWWRQAVVARDMGRDLLRIHGTGLVNTNPQSTYYPFIPSLGCIKNREGTYDGVEYKDQRLMLDQMMEALGLNPIYENEPSIHGLLYVIELDDQARAVEQADIESIISVK
jgi:hypothetical protein